LVTQLQWIETPKTNKVEDSHPGRKRVLTFALCPNHLLLQPAFQIEGVIMRRVMLFALLAMALPTTLFASSITISVRNPSFERLPHGGLPEACGPHCHFSEDAPIPGWTYTGTGTFGQFQPGTQAGDDTFFDMLPPGRRNITSAYLNDGTLSQTVGKVKDGLIYTFSVYLGHRNDLPFLASADVLVGTREFMAKGTPPSAGHWSKYTVTFVGTAGNAGQPITIQLNSSGPQGNFDNVRLQASPVSEPSTLGLLGTGLIGLGGMVRRKLKA
jgi:hypothetical protein